MEAKDLLAVAVVGLGVYLLYKGAKAAPKPSKNKGGCGCKSMVKEEKKPVLFPDTMLNTYDADQVSIFPALQAMEERAVGAGATDNVQICDVATM